ncbi:MAG TPA: hypothetical protein VMS56_15825, partial [Thermoanaerobaculia bacterium]|nr:hypothetical protein [Thermoanaerobaculia bacterium]
MPLRKSAYCALAAAMLAVPVVAGELHLDAIVSGRAGVADGDRSWLEGGWGKSGFGGDEDESSRTSLLGDVRLGLDWRPADRFGIVLTGVVRAEPSRYEGEAAGVTEAYAEGLLFFKQADRLRVRVGMFFLPTSLENTGPMWSSPYTISYSAINSWIGEEVRPIGLDLDYRIEGATRLSLGGTVFVGNDTMGTLLAWRGWSMHDRVSVFDEVLPLPDLWSLSEVFVLQRD